MGSLRKGTIYENEKQVLTEITKPFKITETEVTQKQWFQVMGRNPSHFKRSGDCDNRDKVNEICPIILWKMCHGMKCRRLLKN